MGWFLVGFTAGVAIAVIIAQKLNYNNMGVESSASPSKIILVFIPDYIRDDS